MNQNAERLRRWPRGEVSSSFGVGRGEKLAQAFGVGRGEKVSSRLRVILVTKDLPEESDLLQITGAPSADKQMQAERHALSNTKRTVHGFRHQRNHITARLEQSQQPSSECSFHSITSTEFKPP